MGNKKRFNKYSKDSPTSVGGIRSNFWKILELSETAQWKRYETTSKRMETAWNDATRSGDDMKQCKKRAEIQKIPALFCIPKFNPSPGSAEKP